MKILITLIVMALMGCMTSDPAGSDAGSDAGSGSAANPMLVESLCGAPPVYPAGLDPTYNYDGSGNLVSVTYTVKQYEGGEEWLTVLGDWQSCVTHISGTGQSN